MFNKLPWVDLPYCLFAKVALHLQLLSHHVFASNLAQFPETIWHFVCCYCGVTIHTAPKLDTYQMEATLLCDSWLDASINLAYRLGKLTLILFVRAERTGI